ncbi:MAG TPA: hypothetical protein VEL74_13525, partial [Thermoanaerobaculia bacterium]|nr:hypothetical protein [Thermoanaerobaculia bacterium]
MTKRWKWARRLLIAVLLVAALYPLTANVFLNTPLGSWVVNRRPSVQVTWDSAWSLWPGRVHARGLEVRGHQRSVRWWVAAERADGYIDLPGLFQRRIEIRDLRGEGVRSSVIREPRKPGALRPRRRPGRKGWTTRLPGVTLATVREIRYGDFVLSGSGEARGGFSVQVGGDFQLLPTTLRMTGARLDRGPGEARQLLVRDADVRTEVRIEPYAVREHPGMEGWDFLSGHLEARGSVPDPPLLDRLGNAAGGAASLAVDVRAGRGRFVPGSRVSIEPRPGREQAPLRVAGSVAAGPAGPVLLLTLQAAGLQLGATTDRPPLIHADALDLAAKSSEVRLRHLFTTVRQINRSRTMSSPLTGTARARGVRLDLRGSRLASRIDLDQAEGRVDLAALLERRLILTGLRSEGGAIRLALAGPSGTRPSAAPPWAVHLDGARLAGLREIGFEPFVLRGDTALEASLSLEPGGPLQVDTAALSIRGASLVAEGATVAQRVGIQARGRLDPMVLGELPGIQALRFVSGSVDLTGRISSFGFLETYFAGTPWLNFSGSGDLRLGLRVERGHLGPGTTIAIPNARLE